MKLSAPIFRLKHKAKKLSRETGVPLSQALNQIAKDEGFSSWSLLASRASTHRLSTRLFAQLKSGDLILLAARPGHGKTMMGLALIADALKAGRQGAFFTLEYNERDVLERYRAVGGEAGTGNGKFCLDCSDAICADYIIDRLPDAERGTVIVIDYLQLLDQKRNNPDISQQLPALKAFASKTGAIVVCLSQIDRAYDLSGRLLPGITDIRLPNALNLALFNKACFLSNGEMRIDAIG
jgi:replicative DNA helicase